MTQIPLSRGFRQTATRRRRDGGAYVSGRYTGLVDTDTSINCNIQPPSASKGHDFLKTLPEAQRTREVVVVYCPPNTLRTANEGNNQAADRIIFLGKTYEAQRVNFWPGSILTHDQVYCTRLDND